MAASRTTPDLRAVLDQSGLLDPGLLAPILADPASVDPEALRRRLLSERLLTPFQAEQLAKGRADGFFLTDKFKILDFIGAGGMGKVYLCEHLLLHRLVALKLLQLPADGPDAARSFERFYREARAVAALSDPNIIRVFDVDRVGPAPFMVMEYADGTNLHDLVSRFGPLAADRASDYIRQAALGLQHAFEVGLVHRDIKPGNLILDRTGTVKVLDLGLARFHLDPARNEGITDRYDKNMVLGTVDFMAPEQAFDTEKVDIRSDIYGLGCTLYYLLTGSVPFPDRSAPEKMYAHKTRAPAPVSEICPRVPIGLLEVLDRLMAKDPAERYQTPAEVAAALAPLVHQQVPPPPSREMPEHPATFYRLGLAAAPGVAASEAPTPHPMTRLETDRADPPGAWVLPGFSTPRPRGKPPSTGGGDPSIVVVALPPSAGSSPRLRAVRRNRRLVRLAEMLLFVLAAGGVGWLASREWMHADRPPAPVADPVPPPAVAPKDQPNAFDGPVVGGGGVTFADPIVRRWAGVYEKQHGVRVDYRPIGLAEGVKGMIDRVYPFGCTVGPLTDVQMAGAVARGEEVVHVPLALGAVAIAYNLPDVKGEVRFTGPVLADIYLGKITRWNDGPMKANNPGLDLPDLPVTVVHHTEPTGTTALFADFLYKTSPAWQADMGERPDPAWPLGTGAKGNDGTAAQVGRTPGAIGYMELSFAVGNTLRVGRVQNRDGQYVAPTTAGMTAAATSAFRTMRADLRYTLTDALGEEAYPIAGLVFALVYADQAGRPGARELVAFLRWATHDGQAFVEELKFARLPPDLVKRTEDRLAGVRVK